MDRMRKPFRLTTALIVACMCSAVGLARADKVDDYITDQMAKRHVPGLSVAVIRDGKVALSKGFGLANVELSVPATESTVYELASVTKQFTATGIMMLAEEGK